MIYPVNGKNNTSKTKTVKWTGHRCIGSCNAAVVEVETENRTRYWSKANDWPNNTIPEEGQDVFIESGWNMVFDLEDSPKFKVLQINGILTFSNVSNCHLHAEHIFVRAGELHIGSAEYPMTFEARITLHGLRNMESIVYDNAIEAGNKILANVGVVKMFGKHRQKMTRLTAPAPQKATSITIETGMDLVQGDRLGLAPTSYDAGAYEDHIVNTYNNVTGEVTFNTSLKHYHWGAAESTSPKYNGLDIRGEVVLLTRNIILAGEDTETWGGQFVTSDTLEMGGDGEMKLRSGQTIMHNVEVFNCSQKNTEKAAIRFEGASGKHSHLSGLAVHNGNGWGINVAKSANVKIEDTTVFGFLPLGLVVMSSNNVTIHNNIVIGISERNADSFTTQKSVDIQGAISICAISPGDVCNKLSVTHNIAAGSTYASFLMQASDCDKNDMKFRHNVGHSTHKGQKMGAGAVIFPTPGSNQASTCYEVRDFAAYKTHAQGVTGIFAAKVV